MASIIT